MKKKWAPPPCPPKFHKNTFQKKAKKPKKSYLKIKILKVKKIWEIILGKKVKQ